MNTLIVCDVFETYYDGRKASFVSETVGGRKAEVRDEYEVRVERGRISPPASDRNQPLTR